jgi:hypothetical protein
MQLAERLVEAWRHDHSGFADADRPILARQQARFTELTAADLSGADSVRFRSWRLAWRASRFE